MSILTDELEERYPVDQGAIMPLLDREQVALMQRRNYTAGAKRQRTPRNWNQWPRPSTNTPDRTGTRTPR